MPCSQLSSCCVLSAIPSPFFPAISDVRCKSFFSFPKKKKKTQTLVCSSQRVFKLSPLIFGGYGIIRNKSTHWPLCKWWTALKTTWTWEWPKIGRTNKQVTASCFRVTPGVQYFTAGCHSGWAPCLAGGELSKLASVEKIEPPYQVRGQQDLLIWEP